MKKNHTGPHKSVDAILPDQGDIRLDYPAIIFLVAACWFVPIGEMSGTLGAFRTVFVSIVLEAIPFMLIGSLVGGLIEAFVSRERLASLLPRRGWLTVAMAAGAGAVFPVCECAVVPVVRRLVGKGLPFSAAVAYLLGGPIVNPVVAASTALAYAFDWRIVLLRVGLGYVIAISVALFMGRLFEKADPVNTFMLSCDFRHHSVAGPDDPSTCGHTVCGCGCHHEPGTGWTGKIKVAVRHAMDDFLSVGHFLIIGAFIAALAQTYIDRSSLLDFSGAPVVSIVLMMVLAIFLNLCSEADAFIAASFQGLVSLPAQMAFMLTGPTFDLKLLLMYQTVFRRRVIGVLATTILVVILAVTLVLEWLGGVMP